LLKDFGGSPAEVILFQFLYRLPVEQVDCGARFSMHLERRSCGQRIAGGSGIDPPDD